MAEKPQGRSYLPPETPDLEPSGLATFSLFAGLAGWLVFPFFGGLAAVFLGHRARLDIARSRGKLGGDRMAVAGLLLGYSNVLICAVGIMCIAAWLLLPALDQLFR
jgi:hypothetical protein